MEVIIKYANKIHIWSKNINIFWRLSLSVICARFIPSYRKYPLAKHKGWGKEQV